MVQAAKLLGVKSFDDVIASEGQQTIKEVFRPPLLGLGADPKKHGKASTSDGQADCAFVLVCISLGNMS